MRMVWSAMLLGDVIAREAAAIAALS